MTPTMADHTAGASEDDTRSSVKARLTPNRPRRSVENDEYGHSSAASCAPAAAVSATVTSRPWPSCSAEEIDTAIAEAVKGLRVCDYSWAEIGSRLGITRQACPATLGTTSRPPERARCVPGRTVERGHSRSLTDTGPHRLTCIAANRRPRTRSFPSWLRRFDSRRPL